MKSRIRRWLFKIAPVFIKLSEKLISAGYFIRCSTWLKKYNVPYLNGTFQLREFLIDSEKINDQPVDFFECGVSEGWGLRNWLKLITNINFYGFDTFKGIPDDWGNIKKGEYSANGQIPDIKDQRCKLIKGLFQKTLQDFLKNYKVINKKIIHLDADLYSSTFYLLMTFKPYLIKGDILVFDEFFSLSKADHEFRAFEDFCNLYDFKFKAIAKSPNQLAIKVI